MVFVVGFWFGMLFSKATANGRQTTVETTEEVKRENKLGEEGEKW
jgi:hypothetical protein